jgi:hypothetical protein
MKRLTFLMMVLTLGCALPVVTHAMGAKHQEAKAHSSPRTATGGPKAERGAYSSAAKHCGDVKGGAAGEIRARRTGCREARAVARHALDRIDFPSTGGDWSIDARLRVGPHRWKCRGKGFSPLPVRCHPTSSRHARVRFNIWPEGGGRGARGNPRFLVPVTKSRSGFGPYRESAGSRSAARLRKIYGAPRRMARKDKFGCVMRWPRLGLVARLTTYGLVDGPCRNGVFNSATLTSRRWHTSSGVHPGGSARTAKRHSVRNCLHRTDYKCGGVKGYALGLHPSDCAAGRFPTVIARVKHGHVRSLEVFKHSCE